MGGGSSTGCRWPGVRFPVTTLGPARSRRARQTRSQGRRPGPGHGSVGLRPRDRAAHHAPPVADTRTRNEETRRSLTNRGRWISALLEGLSGDVPPAAHDRLADALFPCSDPTPSSGPLISPSSPATRPSSSSSGWRRPSSPPVGCQKSAVPVSCGDTPRSVLRLKSPMIRGRRGEDEFGDRSHAGRVRVVRAPPRRDR
jgi:hypothetical protein